MLLYLPIVTIQQKRCSRRGKRIIAVPCWQMKACMVNKQTAVSYGQTNALLPCDLLTSKTMLKHIYSSALFIPRGFIFFLCVFHFAGCLWDSTSHITDSKAFLYFECKTTLDVNAAQPKHLPHIPFHSSFLNTQSNLK